MIWGVFALFCFAYKQSGLESLHSGHSAEKFEIRVIHVESSEHVMSFTFEYV